MYLKAEPGYKSGVQTGADKKRGNLKIPSLSQTFVKSDGTNDGKQTDQKW